MNVNAIGADFVAGEGKFQGPLRALAHNRDVDGRALGPAHLLHDVVSAQIVGGLAIHRDDDVAGAHACPRSRSSRQRRDHNDMVVARADGHAHAVVFALLRFFELGELLGIKEGGMRVEHVQHAGDGAVEDGLVGIHLLGVVLLDDVIHFGELLQAAADLRVGGEPAAGDLAEEDAEPAAA